LVEASLAGVGGLGPPPAAQLVELHGLWSFARDAKFEAALRGSIDKAEFGDEGVFRKEM
jgi:hypothetical protein